MFKRIFKILFLGALFFLVIIYQKQIVGRISSFFLAENGSPKKSINVGLVKNEQKILDDRNFKGTTDDIILLVNQEREKMGVRPLIKNELLAKSALAKAEDMRDKEYFEHISPEGLQPWFFVEQAGYKYKTVGENLAEGFFSAQSVHAGWMNSPGHRDNILADNFEEIGIAIVSIKRNGRQSYLAVQHFGSQLRPENLKPTIICDKKVKEYYDDAKDKKKEVKDTIKKQEKIIKKAKRQGVDKKWLKEAGENLTKLKEIKKDIKKYIEKCEKYIKGCDQWK